MATLFGIPDRTRPTGQSTQPPPRGSSESEAPPEETESTRRSAYPIDRDFLAKLQKANRRYELKQAALETVGRVIGSVIGSVIPSRKSEEERARRAAHRDLPKWKTRILRAAKKGESCTELPEDYRVTNTMVCIINSLRFSKHVTNDDYTKELQKLLGPKFTVGTTWREDRTGAWADKSITIKGTSVSWYTLDLR